MSLYEEAKARVIMDSVLSEEFEVKVWMHQGSVLPPLLFAVVVYVVTEFVREGVLRELPYALADDLELMKEIIEGLGNMLIKWKGTFDSKGFKVNLGKTTVMDSGGITEDGMSKSKAGPCGVVSLRAKAK